MSCGANSGSVCRCGGFHRIINIDRSRFPGSNTTSDNRLPHGNAALCATRLHTSGFLACQSRDMGEPHGMAGAGSSAGQSDEELAVARVVKTYSPPGVVARLRFITREARDGARRQAYLRLIDTIQQHTCSVDMYTVRPCVGAWGAGRVLWAGTHETCGHTCRTS